MRQSAVSETCPAVLRLRVVQLPGALRRRAVERLRRRPRRLLVHVRLQFLLRELTVERAVGGVDPHVLQGEQLGLATVRAARPQQEPREVDEADAHRLHRDQVVVLRPLPRRGDDAAVVGAVDVDAVVEVVDAVEAVEHFGSELDEAKEADEELFVERGQRQRIAQNCARIARRAPASS